MSDLETRLLAAHAREDRAGLVDLYAEAADHAASAEARAFYLVQSYVFALETDHPAREDIRGRLVAMGREA